MIIIPILYRFLLAIFLCFLNVIQWIHRIIIHLISRSCYTITVNIDVSRNDPLNITNDPMDKIQFNKPTQALAMIINERIPDIDLWKFISNSIFFFRKLNIEHLIIYDYEGYIKVREASIMDYVHTCDKK
ncbi:unnamed protein product, partial [Rotaria magnacalcarata]